MPVTSKVGGLIRDHDEMESPGRDGELASRAQILLGRRIGLHRGDGYPEKIAHASTTNAAIRPMMSIAMSALFLFESRKGLKPILQR